MVVSGWFDCSGSSFSRALVGHRNEFIVLSNQVKLTSIIEVPIQVLERYFQESSVVSQTRMARRLDRRDTVRYVGTMGI